MFTGHKEITNFSEPTGFEQYLLVSFETDGRHDAYGFDANTPMDLEAMLQAVFEQDGLTVETERQSGGSNYAAIITDGRTPDSVVVWESCDFYLSGAAD